MWRCEGPREPGGHERELDADEHGHAEHELDGRAERDAEVTTA